MKPQDAATEALAEMAAALALADGYVLNDQNRTHYAMIAKSVMGFLRVGGYVIRKARKSG